MKIIGSYNNLPLSLLTRIATRSKSSHVLFVFDDALVIQSTLTSGVDLSWFEKWKKHNLIAWQVEVPLSLEKEEEVYKALLKCQGGSGYDYLALAYWFWCGLQNLLFGKSYPATNAWQSASRKLCIGVYAGLPDWLTGPKPSEEEIEMTTPDQIGKMIEDHLSETGGK